MSSIYEAANRNRNFSIAFFSIRDTYERLMPSRAATCFCVYSAFPPRPYRRRSTCFSCSFNSNPDNSTAAPRPLSGCTVPRYPPRRPPRCRADGSHFPPCRFRSARRGKSPVPFSFLLRRYISSSLSIQRAAYAASRFPFFRIICHHRLDEADRSNGNQIVEIIGQALILFHNVRDQAQIPLDQNVSGFLYRPSDTHPDSFFLPVQTVVLKRVPRKAAPQRGFFFILCLNCRKRACLLY